MSGAFIPNYPSGTKEVTIQYADNESVAVELDIFLSPRDWSEIQEKPFYQELIQYLDSLKTQDIEEKAQRGGKVVEHTDPRNDYIRERYMKLLNEYASQLAEKKLIEELKEEDQQLAEYAAILMGNASWNVSKRFANEWFMRSEDSRYWRMTKRLVNQKIKKITALALASTVISAICYVLILLHMCL